AFYLENADFQVERADCLAAGLERLARPGIDAILLDLTLPDSQGLDTFFRVRARTHSPVIPVVIVTGLDDVKLGAKAVEAAAQAYLIKGQTTRATLARALHYALERTWARSAEWEGTMFRLAQQQFLKAAQLTALDDNIRQRLLFPQRTQIVAFPFRRDEYEQ